MNTLRHAPPRIGIDLGGTKIEIIALDADRNALLRRRIPTPAGDYDGIVRAIASLVTEAEAELGTRASVGVGTPGSISPHTHRIRNANSTALNGRPFERDLQTALGREIRMTNDANCFALSEAIDGAGAGAPSVFGVILGTGVGGGIAVDGRIVEGANGIAGEWGHNPLPWPQPRELPGPVCYCGKRGCIEAFLCGPALSREYRAGAGEGAAPTEIASRAAAGEPWAGECLAQYIDRLARGLATVINLLDPHAVVLGGGVSNVEQLYAALPERLPEYVFSDTVRTRILRAVHGDSSGVRGAAMLW